MTSLEAHIDYELSHGEMVEEFIDEEYLGSQCPSCRKVFPNDDEMLAHICPKENSREY